VVNFLWMMAEEVRARVAMRLRVRAMAEEVRARVAMRR
jgi:hypothetical protein